MFDVRCSMHWCEGKWGCGVRQNGDRDGKDSTAGNGNGLGCEIREGGERAFVRRDVDPGRENVAAGEEEKEGDGCAASNSAKTRENGHNTDKAETPAVLDSGKGTVQGGDARDGT